MRKLGLLFVTAVILVTASPASAEEQHRRGQTITGTWEATFRLPAGSSICTGAVDCFVPALATATSDGTLIQTAAVPNISEGHGVWARTGLRTFSLRSKYFRYGAGGVLIGFAEARTIATLDADGMSGSGSYEIQLLNLDGSTFGLPFNGSVEFQRMVP
jgi:hypothetical protein